MNIIRIGTRESKLAMIQAEMVERAINKHCEGIKTELVPMKTTGDIILDKTLDKIGGKGLFVKELDKALLQGKADITVHSCKDLPMELDSRLPVVAISQREDERDALVLPHGIDELDTSKPIGCSSSRRRIQLKQLYPGVETKTIRGNVITRLKKLDDGEYSALVLAAAGLRRLDLEGRISRLFTTDEMMPAACQGFLAVQARQGEDVSFLDGFKDDESMLLAMAERAFVRALDGGCSKPCAAYARMEGGMVKLRGMYVNDDESVVRFGSVECTCEDAEIQAKKLAEGLKDE